MKVLIVSVGKIFGGIEKYTIDLVNGLASSQYEIHVAVREDGQLIKHVENNNILSLNLTKKNFFSSMRKIKKYVEDNKIDVIHCNSNNALLLSMFSKKSIKKIAVIHGDVEIDQMRRRKLAVHLYKFLETKLIKKCNGCIAVSASLKEILVSRGINEEAIRVVYNGLSLIDYDCEPNYEAEYLKICSVGNLLPSKNQIVLLEALNILQTEAPEIKFICDIYGEGSKREMLQAYIDDNNIKGVTLKGFKENVRHLLNQYMVYVQPSLYESFGIAVTEAMNAGCCVIVSSVGGMKEIVDDKSGFQFKCDDSRELADILQKCYNDRITMEEKATRGKEKVYNTFTVEKMIQNTKGFYEDIVCKGVL